MIFIFDMKTISTFLFTLSHLSILSASAQSFSAGIIMPFGKYDQGSMSLSKWNSNEQHMRIDMRIPYLSISYNLQWGRQKRGAQKIIDANANTDRSTAGGR